MRSQPKRGIVTYLRINKRAALVFVALVVLSCGYLAVRLSQAATSAYTTAVLNDNPVAFWAMTGAGATEPDLTGHGHTATYQGGTPAHTAMINGDQAVDFNGSSQYASVPSAAGLSITASHQFTWEGWIRPDVLQYPHDSGYGYIDWMGKCQDYSPSCEWEARMYSATNPEGRCNRISAYVFNPGAGLGSAADWQPNCNLLQAGQWLHVVGEYQTLTTPAGCSSAYPGSINIWVNGVAWNKAYHGTTGCMSQYNIKPQAGGSPLNIGTMALETWFKGAVGKVAVYNYLLSQSQINNHFFAMTGANPSGSCANSCNIPVPTQVGAVPTATPTPAPPHTPAPTPAPTPPPAHTPTPGPTSAPAGSAPGATVPVPGGGDPAAASKPKTEGSIQLGSPAAGEKTIIKIDGAVVSTSGLLDTTYLTNGPHKLTVQQGNVVSTRTIQVQNKLNPLESLRNSLFAGFHGNKTLTNGSITAILIALAVMTLCFLIVKQKGWALKRLQI